MEILAAVTVEVDKVAVIFLSVVSIVCLAIVLTALVYREYLVMIVPLIVFILSLGSLLMTVYRESPPTYEVLIHDISEFDYERYEIIEQRGKIFVVKERTIDN